MPTRAQIDRVIDEIRRLREDYSFQRLDEGHVTLASRGRATEDGYFFWDELTEAHRRDALAHGIAWDGFDAGERADVIGRVLDGEPPGLWMQGIEHFNPEEDFARPLTRAARSNPHKDIAFRTDWDHLRPEPEGQEVSPADLAEARDLSGPEIANGQERNRGRSRGR